jgi:hypothetical protein
VSKAHSSPHRNKLTGDLLNQKEQVCPVCFENFKTTEAGDKHRVGSYGVDRKCESPSNIGLVPIKNKFGTRVWKLK